MAGAETRRVVDQDIDAAEGRAGLGDIPRDRRRIGKIADCGMRPDPVLLDLGADAVERLGASGTDRNRGSRLGVGERDRPPDASAAAGHHCTLSGKIDVHGVCPFSNLGAMLLVFGAWRQSRERFGCVWSRPR
jgi:hypothetical protein